LNILLFDHQIFREFVQIQGGKHLGNSQKQIIFVEKWRFVAAAALLYYAKKGCRQVS